VPNKGGAPASPKVVANRIPRTASELLLLKKMKSGVQSQSGPPTSAERSAVLYTRKQLEALNRTCAEQVCTPVPRSRSHSLGPQQHNAFN
jgi:hypothetical protein